MALLGIIRRWHIRDQVPLREIARRLGISRNTVRRHLRSGTIEPAYAERRSTRAIDKYAFQLSALLKSEAAKSRKQRRTLKQIHEDLKELGFEGSYDRVAAFARTWREGQTERVNPASKRTQEALSGLIIRLARAHTCDPKKLLNLEILQNTALKQLRPTGGFVSFDLRTMNGGGKYAGEVSRRLEELTLRDNLINCSFLPWSNIIATKGIGVLHLHPHWCSNCIREWRESNTEAYLPLLWFAYSVSSCIKHGNILSSKCSNCDKNQPFVPRHTSLDHCSWCGHWLGEERDSHPELSKTGSIDGLQIFQREAIGEMISNPPGSNFGTFENFLFRLKSVIATEFNGVVIHCERSIGFREHSIKQWLNGKRPSLPLFILMTQRLGTTPVQFLEGNVVNASLCKGESFSFQRIVKKYPIADITHKEIENTLRSIISSGESKIPTKVVAEQLGYKYSWLKYWHPDSCVEISKLHRQHLSKEALRKRNNAENITREIVRTLFEKKIKITRRVVQKLLFPHRILLSRPEIRAAFNDEKRVLLLPFFAPHGQKK